ncbi:C-type lectin domain family 2 member D-like isoform X3 [Dermochelys coriacea]|uniref:C-type lectin domain family 2 member D-like isoform X3 n=1 Tax=Dermochelys coriacea TaxID=27794 RepID=UPI001CA883B4|nr:C-type lectin domain family 2 member D-like isoform X3 [Dermochelys coriacea]
MTPPLGLDSQHRPGSLTAFHYPPWFEMSQKPGAQGLISPCSPRWQVSLTPRVTVSFSVWRPKLPSADLGPPAGPTCPDGWIGYRGKCCYFSEAKRNWTYSLTNCSALSASLAEINSKQEMDFLLRYKGKPDHWLGLQRDPGQLWKWTNGTEFNNLFVIGGGGDCAYLNDENRVSSLRCTSKRHWICTKPNEFTKAQEDAVEGG